MENKDSQYRNIIKSTIVFGGIKVVEILITVIRVKIVALLLGPVGVGLQSIFQSTLFSLNQFSSLGIFQSAVREISQVRNDHSKLDEVVGIVSRWGIFVGLIGALFCCLLSNVLSHFLFKNSDYTIHFLFLSFASFFFSLSSSNISIMQGRGQLKDLATGSLIGSFLSLILTVPIYLYYGIKGIIPAFILGYLLLFIVNSYFIRKEKIKQLRISFKETLIRGKEFVKLGIVLMFANFLMTLFSFFLNAFISNYGQVEDIGLFQASFTITYGNLIILVAILSSDYYPRLSSVHDKNEEVQRIVNDQIEFFLLIMLPITVCLIVFTSLFVELLYSRDFLVIVPTLRSMALALVFRIIWYSLSYIILAKGDKKSYFIYDAILGNGLGFLLNIIGYYWGGLYGLGISYLINSLLVCFILGVVVNVKYKLFFCKKIYKLLFASVLFFITVYILSTFFDSIFTQLICVSIFCLSTCLSIYGIDRRIGFIKRYIKRKAIK